MLNYIRAQILIVSRLCKIITEKTTQNYDSIEKIDHSEQSLNYTDARQVRRFYA